MLFEFLATWSLNEFRLFVLGWILMLLPVEIIFIGYGAAIFAKMNSIKEYIFGEENEYETDSEKDVPNNQTPQYH